MNHPAYTLKNVKKHTGREGPGYRAMLVRVSDGKVLAEVYDAADGGSLSIYPKDVEGYAKFVAYVAPLKLVSEASHGMKAFEIVYEREAWVINRIFDAVELSKTIARVAKTAVVLRLATDDELSYRKVPLQGRPREVVVAGLLRTHPTATILG